MYFYKIFIIFCFYLLNNLYGQTIDSKTIDKIKSGSISSAQIQELIQDQGLFDKSNSSRNSENRKGSSNIDNQVQEILNSNKSINDLSLIHI